MVAIFQSIFFAFEGAVWILAAPVAFICYRLIVTIGFRMSRRFVISAKNLNERMQNLNRQLLQPSSQNEVEMHQWREESLV